MKVTLPFSMSHTFTSSSKDEVTRKPGTLELKQRPAILWREVSSVFFCTASYRSQRYYALLNWKQESSSDECPWHRRSHSRSRPTNVRVIGYKYKHGAYLTRYWLGSKVFHATRSISESNVQRGWLAWFVALRQSTRQTVRSAEPERRFWASVGCQQIDWIWLRDEHSFNGCVSFIVAPTDLFFMDLIEM